MRKIKNHFLEMVKFLYFLFLNIFRSFHPSDCSLKLVFLCPEPFSPLTLHSAWSYIIPRLSSLRERYPYFISLLDRAPEQEPVHSTAP